MIRTTVFCMRLNFAPCQFLYLLIILLLRAKLFIIIIALGGKCVEIMHIQEFCLMLGWRGCLSWVFMGVLSVYFEALKVLMPIEIW